MVRKAFTSTTLPFTATTIPRSDYVSIMIALSPSLAFTVSKPKPEDKGETKQETKPELKAEDLTNFLSQLGEEEVKASTDVILRYLESVSIIPSLNSEIPIALLLKVLFLFLFEAFFFFFLITKMCINHSKINQRMIFVMLIQ